MRERDCVLSERKGLPPGCSVGAKETESEDHQRNFLARRERRAREQPETRQSRLERLRERDHERRAMEQPEARQSRLETLRERVRQQRAAGMNPNQTFISAPGTVMYYDCVYMHSTSFHLAHF